MRSTAPADGAAGTAHAPEPTRGIARLLTRLWDAAVRHPRLALLLLVAFQTVPVLGIRDLYLGDEVRHGSVLQHLVHDGHAMVLHLNGEPYPDKPPLWFWFVGTLSWVSGSTDPWVFFLAAAVAAALLALATLRLAREMGLTGGAALAPAVALSVVPLTALLARTTRMDLLFAVFITLAGISLYRGLTRPGATRSTLAAFAWAGAATWTKGPFGVLLPLATAFGFLLWRGQLRRLLRGDVLLGVGLYVVLVGVWALGVVLDESGAFLASLLQGQVVERFADASHHKEAIWYYAAALGPVVLPWSLLPFTLPWRPARWGARLRAAWATRRAGDDAHAWLVAWVVSGLVVLSVTSTKFVIYLAPLLPALLILATTTLLRASPAAQRRFWTVGGALGLLLALALPFAALAEPLAALHVTDVIPTAAALLAGSLLTLAVRRGPFGAALLASSLGFATATLVAAGTLPYSLDPLLSPRGTGMRLQQLEAQGFTPAVYGLYGGQIAYHVGHPVFETRLLERADAGTGRDGLAEFLAREPRAVVVLPVKRWELLRERFPSLRRAYEQQLLDGMLVLALQGSARAPQEGERR